MRTYLVDDARNAHRTGVALRASRHGRRRAIAGVGRAPDPPGRSTVRAVARCRHRIGDWLVRLRNTAFARLGSTWRCDGSWSRGAARSSPGHTSISFAAMPSIFPLPIGRSRASCRLERSSIVVSRAGARRVEARPGSASRRRAPDVTRFTMFASRTSACGESGTCRVGSPIGTCAGGAGRGMRNTIRSH